MTEDHIVFIADDDARIREAVSELLESHGIRAVTYTSADAASARARGACMDFHRVPGVQPGASLAE
jgi:FixJ family two-component response regulator